MRQTTVIKTVGLITAVTLTACQNTPASTIDVDRPAFDASYIELGQEVAKTHCAVCHNISPTGASPRADAPPLRLAFGLYNPGALGDDFREHIHVGHPDMPDFDFTVKETEGLLAYLNTIQETPE
jgi:mono/diheme cytochrome c family protein